MTTIEPGQRFDAEFGQYRVRRIDGDVVVMVDINRPTACVMPTRDKLGPGLNFWPVVDEARSLEDRIPPVVAAPPGEAAASARPSGDAVTPAAPPAAASPSKPAKPKRAAPAAKPKPPAMTSICGVPFRPRISDAEACPWLGRLGRYSCGFTACPSSCPRAPAFVAAAPAARNPDPPPLTALELAAIWARVDQVPGRNRAEASSSTAPATAPVEPDPPAAAPEPDAARAPLLPLEPAPEAPLAPPPPADAVAGADQVASSRRDYPPCFVCDQYRPIMLTMAPRPGKGADDYASMCSRCAQGHPCEDADRDRGRHRLSG